MNLKIFAFAAAVLSGIVSGQPDLPECTIGTDTSACTTPFGEDGYFVCRVQDETSNLRPSRPPAMEGMGGRFGRRRGGHGLTRSKCVPVDPPELGMEPIGDEESPFGDDIDFPRPRVECGCCDGVCPSPVECDCGCEITLPYGAVMQGSKATIVKPDGSEVNKCVPPAYADEGSVTCITDCSVEVETRFPF